MGIFGKRFMPNLNHGFILGMAVLLPCAAFGATCDGQTQNNCPSGCYWATIGLPNASTSCRACPHGYDYSTNGASQQGQCYKTASFPPYQAINCYYRSDTDCQNIPKCGDTQNCTQCDFVCTNDAHIEHDDGNQNIPCKCALDERDCADQDKYGGADGIASCTEKWNADNQEYFLNKLTCKSNYIKHNNQCIINEKDCDSMPTHAKTCKMIWDSEKNDYVMHLTCDKNYIAIDNKCKNITETDCLTYILGQQELKSLYQACTTNHGNFHITGNLTTESGQASLRNCLCKKTGATQVSGGKCYQAYALVGSTGNYTWADNTHWADCVCKDYFCPNETHGCAIPAENEYWDKDSRECQTCPMGTKTKFGNDTDAYDRNPKRTAGSAACFVDRTTTFCDAFGCFNLEDISDTNRSYLIENTNNK